MLFEAEAECIPRLSCNDAEQSLIDSKVESLWATASQSHFNVNFQFNSQSTAMQFTPRRTIGGRAWLSMKLKSVDHEKALVLWGNTSLGLLIHWWHSNRQQIGRGNIGKNMLVSMPVLDIDALSPSILKRASAIFDTFSADPMLPINELHQDSVRKQIDEAVMTEVLGLPLALHRPDGPMDLLRRKLASEPSIIGGKRSA